MLFSAVVVTVTAITAMADSLRLAEAAEEVEDVAHGVKP